MQNNNNFIEIYNNNFKTVTQRFPLNPWKYWNRQRKTQKQITLWIVFRKKKIVEMAQNVQEQATHTGYQFYIESPRKYSTILPSVIRPFSNYSLLNYIACMGKWSLIECVHHRIFEYPGGCISVKIYNYILHKRFLLTHFQRKPLIYFVFSVDKGVKNTKTTQLIPQCWPFLLV